jgi:hypothetical protein
MFSLNTIIAWHETYYEYLTYSNKYSLLFASRALSPTIYPGYFIGTFYVLLLHKYIYENYCSPKFGNRRLGHDDVAIFVV